MTSIEQEKEKETKVEKTDKVEAPTQVTSSAADEDGTTRSDVTSGDVKRHVEADAASSQITDISMEGRKDGVTAMEVPSNGSNGMEVDA